MGLPAILMAAATAVTAAGSIAEGNAARGAANANAVTALRNAELARQQRQLDIETARIEAEDKARENRRTMATARASMGTSGFEMAGSPLEVLQDSSIEMALDVRRIEFEGQVRGREGTIKAMGFESQASSLKAEGQNAAKAGRVSAFGSLLSGGSRTAAMANK